MSFKKTLTNFIIILAAISGITGYVYYRGNTYSKETLKLEILAPTETEVAGEIEYTVKYKNNGNVRLEEPRLIFEYPEHSIIEEEQAMRREVRLDDIYPGEERTLRFQARLLGKKGDTEVARAILSYQPKNLQARYEVETSHTALITNVPLTFEFDLPSKAEAGKEISFRLNYFSNIDYPLSNLRIKIEYPSDFEFTKSNPVALENNEWELGILNKADGGRVEVFGKQNGEIGEQKIFKAELGIWQDGEFILLKETIRGIQIVNPNLYISQQINGNPEYIANLGDVLHYEIFFKNIGEDALESLFLVARLEGEALDFQTLKAPLANFEPGDNSIIWDWRRISKLQILGPQEEGRVEFWMELKKDLEMAGPDNRNFTLKNKIYLSQARAEFITKVNSKLAVEQRGYFQDEVFGNSGPIPPRVGEDTTYTVIWQAKNYHNDVKNVKVKAKLSDEVKLTGKIFPEDSRLTFDSKSREVVWEVGDLEAGKGVLNPGPSVALQLALTPASEKEKFVLISEPKIFGEDAFTGASLEFDIPVLDTSLEIPTGEGL